MFDKFVINHFFHYAKIKKDVSGAIFSNLGSKMLHLRIDLLFKFNTYFYIGKDERIILFIINKKYWSLCYFFTIYYTDDIEYYTNNNIKQQKIIKHVCLI